MLEPDPMAWLVSVHIEHLITFILHFCFSNEKYERSNFNNPS